MNIINRSIRSSNIVKVLYVITKTKQHLFHAGTNRSAFTITKSTGIQNVQYTYNDQGKSRTNNLYFQEHSGMGQHINPIPKEEEEL